MVTSAIGSSLLCRHFQAQKKDSHLRNYLIFRVKNMTRVHVSRRQISRTFVYTPNPLIGGILGSIVASLAFLNTKHLNIKSLPNKKNLLDRLHRSWSDPAGMVGFCARRTQRALFECHSALTDAVFYTDFRIMNPYLFWR